jgi:integrase
MARKSALPAAAQAEPAADTSAIGWEFGGYYLDVPYPKRGGVYYACRYDAGIGDIRRRSLRTTLGEDAKQALVALCAAAPARASEECPHPRDVLTLHVLEAYLTGHATTIASEGQAIRSVQVITEYLRDQVKNLATPVSFWTPSRQLDFGRYCHATYAHSAATIDRTLSVLGAALNDAAAVKMRPDPLGTMVEGALVSHVPMIVYQRARISKELRIAAPKKGGFVPSLAQMATFIDAIETKHLQRWIILALNTWARPEAITDFEPSRQYNRSTGAIDLNPDGRLQTNKRRPEILATQGLSDWLDRWRDEDIAAYQAKHGSQPNHPLPLLVYKGERVAVVKRAIRRIADEAGVPELTQKTIRAFMATHVRKMCPLVSRERRSLWLGHTVKEGSLTTEHYEAFDVDVLDEVALATDFVIGELQKLTTTRLFSVEVPLTKAELRRIGGTPRSVKALQNRGLNGGRDRDRTCDPYDVNVVLSR